MVGSEWSDPQSDVTEEPAAVVVQSDPSPVKQALRPRSVVPKAQPSGINRGDQRVPVYRDQTVPVWRAGGAAGAKARKGPSINRREICSGDDDQAQAGDGDACSGSSRSPEVSFDAILSMYESSLLEKSFMWSRRVLSLRRLRRRSRSEPGARDGLRRRQVVVRLISASGEPEVQSLRAAIERASVREYDRNSAPSPRHCNALLLERRRSWRDPLSSPTPMLTSSSS